MADQWARRPWEQIKRRHDRLADPFIHASRQAGLKYQIPEPEGEPFQQLLSEWRYHDVLVFGSHGRFDEMVVPDVEATIAWLLRQGVSPIATSGMAPHDIQQVMIVYDGTQEAAEAMRRFLQLRPWANDKLTLTTAIQGEAGQALLGRAREYCLAYGAAPETLQLTGPARKHLLPLARERGTDALVISHPQNLLASQLWMSAARDIVRQAELPLFITG